MECCRNCPHLAFGESLLILTLDLSGNQVGLGTLSIFPSSSLDIPSSNIYCFFFSFHLVVFPLVVSAQGYAGMSEIKHGCYATPFFPPYICSSVQSTWSSSEKVCRKLGTTPILLFIPWSLLSPIPDRSLSYTHP